MPSLEPRSRIRTIYRVNGDEDYLSALDALRAARERSVRLYYAPVTVAKVEATPLGEVLTVQEQFTVCGLSIFLNDHDGEPIESISYGDSVSLIGEYAH